MEHKEMSLSIACEAIVHRHKVLMGVPLTGSVVVMRQLFNQRLFSSKSFITESAPGYPSTLDYLQ